MTSARKHRDAILSNAVRLFRKQGYAATGLTEILEASGAPRGSLYHYFPTGKAAIGAEAVALAGATVASTLREIAEQAQGPGELLSRYFALVAGWMQQSGYRDGSPITTTLLETVPAQAAIRDAGAFAFASWVEIIEASGQASGIAPDRAGALARFSIAALEGALIQCRVSGDQTPLLEAAAELCALYEAAHSTCALPH
jgi:TetR/AcrR family transcriptional repressor of lmrAB and yxaGH operons